MDYLAFSVLQPFFIDFLNPCYLLTNSLSHIFLHRFYLVFVIFPHFLNINQMLFLSNFIGILKLVNFLSCFLFQLKYLLFVHPSKLGAIFFELELQFLVAFFELLTLLWSQILLLIFCLSKCELFDFLELLIDFDCVLFSEIRVLLLPLYICFLYFIITIFDYCLQFRLQPDIKEEATIRL